MEYEVSEYSVESAVGPINRPEPGLAPGTFVGLVFVDYFNASASTTSRLVPYYAVVLDAFERLHEPVANTSPLSERALLLNEICRTGFPGVSSSSVAEVHIITPP